MRVCACWAPDFRFALGAIWNSAYIT